MRPPECSSYLNAKDAFIVAARDIADDLSTVCRGFDQKDLVELDTDVAWCGNAVDPRHVIVHIVGTHGIEALPGSAIQLGLLKQLPPALADPDGDTAIAFVHVLNPWGAHNNRWANENNVNLMSNWAEDEKTLAGAPPGFDGFVDRTLLNPPHPPRAYMSSLAFKAGAAMCMCTMGSKAFTKAVGFPQYTNPEGIFFGGNQVEEVIEALCEHLESKLRTFKNLRYVTVVDVHTGIGDEFGGSLCMTLREQSSSDRVQKLRDAYPIFRNLRTLDPALFKNSVHEHIPRILKRIGSRAKFLGIHQDFGTYRQLDNLDALALENRHYHYSNPGLTAEQKRTKTKKNNEWREYCASFYAPADPAWWDKVIKGGRELVETLIALMSAEDSESKSI